MNRLLPLPIYTFVKIVIRNGGITLIGLLKLPFWLLKTVIFEPLRWLELSYNKQLRQHRITKDPVFILGFYRSGTSYLHEFLTQDERFGYHTNFQMIFPEIMLIGEKWLSPLFNFIFRAFSLTDPVHRGRLSLKFPGEEDGAMTTFINPRGAAWGYFFPAK